MAIDRCTNQNSGRLWLAMSVATLWMVALALILNAAIDDPDIRLITDIKPKRHIRLLRLVVCLVGHRLRFSLPQHCFRTLAFATFHSQAAEPSELST
ncbi:MAG: hypothetical protein R2873_06350 [Caldilineaceae bacterium]